MNRVRIISFVFCFILIFTLENDGVLAQANAHETEISIVAKNKPLREVLHEIMIQSNIKFVFNDNLVEGHHINCHLINVPLENAIKKIMSQAQIAFEILPIELIVLFNDKSPKLNTFSQKTSSFTPTRFSPPTLQGEIKPYYPSQAKWKGLEGSVDMDLYVDMKGEVKKAVVKSSSGHKILDDAAIKFVKELKYNPARKQGKPVDVWVSRTMHYQLVEKEFQPTDNNTGNTNRMTRYANLSIEKR